MATPHHLPGGGGYGDSLSYDEEIDYGYDDAIDSCLTETNPHYALLLSESYVSTGERAWLRWVSKVEGLLGRHLDGDEGDGFSLDSAYEANENGLTPDQYVAEVRADKDAWR